MRTVYLNASYFPAVELLSAIGTAVILLYGGYQAIDGNITIGVLVAFVGYLQSVLRPDPAALAAVHDLPAGNGGDRQDLRPARHRARHGRQARRARPGAIRGEIEFDDVWFSYARGGDAEAGELVTGAEGWALEDVDLHVPRRADAGARRRDRRRQVDAGEAGGALLRPAARQRAGRRARPARPARPGAAQPARDRAAGGLPVLGHGARQHRLRPAGRERGGDRRGDERGRRARVHQTGCPQGSRPRSASAAVALSAGQRQLVAFARALIAEPRILILDEATSNVDVHTERVIEEGLERLLHGRTSIVIAHRLSTIRRADRIVVLEHGRIGRDRHPRRADRGRRALRRLYGTWAESAALGSRPRRRAARASRRPTRSRSSRRRSAPGRAPAPRRRPRSPAVR